ncbi:MAG: glycoside hydrolase family 127 protein [Planctomycetes bacterium]|nr:glycoside hydrolase family 127 protein [Planctomycetota bacterium]
MKKMVAGSLLLVLVVGPLAWAEAMNPAVRMAEERLLQAQPLDIRCVRLLGGPLKHAQDLDARYLLELEPDRMLAGYRLRAGLKPKAEAYGGWDSTTGKQLTGHIAGHYLSAVSLMYAATGDARFQERADYLVREMKEVQDQRGNGYLGALTDAQGADGAVIFQQVAQGNIRAGSFDLNGLWSPWYTLHKTYAGLRDAYRYTGNQTALELEIKFAAWAEGILARLSDAQVQRMLNTEFGGMNEICADLYADTGDARWLALSRRFDHRSFLEPLERHQDNLAGKHGNTQVPKLLGAADRFAYAGDAADIVAASFFWDRVVQHHSFATGGHGKDEYFGPPDALSDRVDGRTAETCNVYNMLKLTRRLFALRPDAHYADFHERALFNHILASMDPNDGRTCYMVPVGRGVQHEYQGMLRSFTCCVGSGMESHALHADGIYFVGANNDSPQLWVNLYAPSTADWTAMGVKLAMDTDFPEGESARITLTLVSPKEFTLAVRRPYWAPEDFTVKVNGQAMPEDKGWNTEDRGRKPASAPNPQFAPCGSYVELKRTWKTGDTIELTLPKTLRLEPLPDNPHRVAILWGPLVLAGDLGPEAERGRGRGSRPEPPKVPVLVAAGQPVTQWLKPVAGEPGRFRTDGVGRETDVDFVPFYRLHRRTYAVYWDLYTPAEWEKRTAERQRKLEIADLDRPRILKLADEALQLAPVAITQFPAPLSQGGPHDFYSNGDYWWPDPNKPDGLPYIQRDGRSNPQNFTAHRLALCRMRDAVAALAAAYALDGQERYAEKAIALLKVFFLDEATRMNPSLLYAQAIPGRVSGRGIGIIDTLHLAEVPPAILALGKSRAMTPETLAGLKRWFADYAQWMTTHKYGVDEMNAKNNHSVAYMVQLAAFATLAGDTAQLDLCRQRYREVFVPQQMAPDGSFPQELKRTKPYGYSIFQLDNMAILCQVLSTERDNLWSFTLADGRGIRKAVEYLYPFLQDKSKWPHQPDVEHFDSWPVRQPALLFAAQAFGEKKYLDLWKSLDPDPVDPEVRRNVAITQPVLWLIAPSDVPLSRN